MIYLLAPSMDFLFRKFIQSFVSNKKTIRELRLVSATNTPFNLPLRETDKTNVNFVINYSIRGGVLKLCTMLDDGDR